MQILIVCFLQAAILVTHDGGDSWQIAYNASSGGSYFNGLVSFANDVFYARISDDSALQSSILTSLDNGRSWHTASLTLSRSAFPQSANGQFIAVGPLGLIQVSDYKSPDFSTFDEGITDPLVQFLVHPPAYSLHGYSFFIHSQDLQSSIRASKDGIEWNVIGSNAPDFNIVYIEDLRAWVGVRYPYYLSISEDLANWKPLQSPPIPWPHGGDYWLSWTYQKGVWLAVWGQPTNGVDPYNLYRAVGVVPGEWQIVQSADYFGQEVVSVNGRFLLYSETTGLYQSQDGLAWSPVSHPLLPPAPLQGHIYASGGHFLFLSANRRTLYMSQDLADWQVFNNWGGSTSEPLIVSVFTLQLDENSAEGHVAVSLDDGSLLIFNGSDWSLTSTLPNNFDGVMGVQLGRGGVYVAVNPASGEIYHTVSDSWLVIGHIHTS